MPKLFGIRSDAGREMMKALVIGGCGFIGSHVVDALLASGASVRVFDRQHERFRPPLRGVEYCIGDFADKMAVAEALTGMDTVLHLVSSTFPGTANLAPAIDVRDNLINTLGLLDLMVEMRIPRLLFLSSGGTVYGAPDRVPVPEDHPLRPINSYGIVKVAIEHYLEMYDAVTKASQSKYGATAALCATIFMFPIWPNFAPWPPAERGRRVQRRQRRGPNL
jgi:UDP-glucose 4-epimerase